MATETNISIPRGSKATLNFTLSSGVLPGSDIRFTVSRAPNSATKMVAPKTCTVTSTTEYNSALSATETDLTPAVYYWDSRCVDSGSETLLGYGLFEITAIAQLPT